MPVVLGLLLAACSEGESEDGFKEVRYVFNTVGPSVSSVLKLEGAEREAAVAELIERGRKEGFPLVEKDSLFPNYMFATFFFKDTARWHDVELEVFGIYDEYRPGDRKLYRIDSTGLYYRSYLFPDDLCLAYRFVLRDTMSGKSRIVSDPRFCCYYVPYIASSLAALHPSRSQEWRTFCVTNDKSDACLSRPFLLVHVRSHL